MAVYPTPTGAPPDKFVAAQTFWLVTYTPGQNNVASRLTGGLQSNLTDFQSLVIAAPTSAQALADAKAEIGLNGFGFAISGGPYTSKAAAQEAASSQTQTQQQQNQAGQIPNPLSGLTQIGNFFGALTQAATWIRLAKVVFGGGLLIIGLAHITGASNSLATAARKVPVPI